MELLAFVLVSIGVIIIPGPNVLVIVSTSLSHGPVRGLQTVAGTSAAMAIQLVIAAIGTAWFVATLTRGFELLKWLGIAYLAYLGITHLLNFTRGQNSAADISAAGSFTRGFITSLTNPKTILFFGAFLPQFINDSQPYLQQVAILSAIFWTLAVMLDSGYALVSGKLAKLVTARNTERYRDGFSGVLYLGASALLAATKTER